MKIFLFSVVALTLTNVGLSMLNYQQGKQLKSLEISNAEHTNLLILESNPEFFTSKDFPPSMQTNCASTEG